MISCRGWMSQVELVKMQLSGVVANAELVCLGFHQSVSFGNRPIWNCSRAAGYEGSDSIRAAGDLVSIPALAESVNERGRESIASSDRIGNGNVIAGSLCELAILVNRTTTLAEGDAHGLETKPGGPATAEVLDGVAWPFGCIDRSIKRFRLEVAELNDVG